MEATLHGEEALRYTPRMAQGSATRGHGVLEGFLARRRIARANKLSAGHRGGRILDIGCGSYPLFLEQAAFREKIGIDQLVTPDQRVAWASRGVTLITRDLDHEPTITMNDASVDVVTMLAVLEHIEPGALPLVLREIRRVLKPGGILVLTTPARWTEPILAALSALRLLSHDEIDEHEETHTRQSIARILATAGFDEGRIECGSFELGMNLWARAMK